MERAKPAESRWHAELRFLVLLVVVLVVLSAALIAQTFWGNGAMLAILGVGIAIGLIVRYLPSGGGGGRHHAH